MNNKILYIGGFELPDRNAAAHRVIANSKIFRDLGYEVLLRGVTKSGNYKGKIDGFHYDSTKYPTSIFEWMNYLIKGNYENIIAKYEPTVVIAYNYPSVALQNLKRYCTKNGIRLIGDITEWYSARRNLLKWIDTTYRMRILNKKMDGLIVISKFLDEYYHNSINLLLPPLVDKNEEKWEEKVLPSKHETKISLVYAGSPGIGGKDRLDYIIDFLSKSKFHDRVKMTVIGITKEQYLAAFKQKKVDDSLIVFLGRISHKEAISIIKSNDFQIFIRENNRVNNAGFPTKFVETITCGIPVITNLTSNIGDYLIEGKNGFIIDLSTDKMFEKSMNVALSATRKEIELMKEYCRCDNTFSYHEYIDSTRVFIKNQFKYIINP